MCLHLDLAHAKHAVPELSPALWAMAEHAPDARGLTVALHGQPSVRAKEHTARLWREERRQRPGQVGLLLLVEQVEERRGMDCAHAAMQRAERAAGRESGEVQRGAGDLITRQH